MIVGTTLAIQNCKQQQSFEHFRGKSEAKNSTEKPSLICSRPSWLSLVDTLQTFHD